MHQLLAVVPDSAVGLSDRIIILTLMLTGQRRAEVLNMKTGNLILDGDRAYYTYRGKGGKQGHRELPQPAQDAIRAPLGAFGKELATIPSEWPTRSRLPRQTVASTDKGGPYSITLTYTATPGY